MGSKEAIHKLHTCNILKQEILKMLLNCTILWEKWNTQNKHAWVKSKCYKHTSWKLLNYPPNCPFAYSATRNIKRMPWILWHFINACNSIWVNRIKCKWATIREPKKTNSTNLLQTPCTGIWRFQKGKQDKRQGQFIWRWINSNYGERNS